VGYSREIERSAVRVIATWTMFRAELESGQDLDGYRVEILEQP
jgi:hypothetical protein